MAVSSSRITSRVYGVLSVAHLRRNAGLQATVVGVSNLSKTCKPWKACNRRKCLDGCLLGNQTGLGSSPKSDGFMSRCIRHQQAGRKHEEREGYGC